MSGDTVVAFGEDTRTMTYEDGLAFIARTRRQLDRFDQALPHRAGETIDPEDGTRIREKLDALEVSLKTDLGII